MRTFRVYRHPTQGAEAVKIGFSWPAFFFGGFWMLAKKLWAFAGMWFGLGFVLGLVEAVTDAAQSEPGLQGIVYLLLCAAYLAVGLVPAFKGNRWRDADLSRRGYELLGTTQAETPDAAISNLAEAASVAQPA